MPDLRPLLALALLPAFLAPRPDAAIAQEAAPDRAELLEEIRQLRERLERLEQLVAAPEAPPAAAPAGEPAPDSASTFGTRTPLPPPPDSVAGFDPRATNGFFLRSPDGLFRLNIGAYTQIRYGINERQDAPPDEDRTTRGWSINRTRIFFEGGYGEDLGYHFRLNINDEGDADLIAAYGQWAFAPGWSIRLGEQFVALSREDWMYAQDVLGMEFSAHDFTFGIGSSFGAQLHRQEERSRWWLAISNGAFGGKSTFSSDDQADVLVSGRAEWMLCGDDWSVWDDLVGRRGRAEGVLLGLGGAYQGDWSDSGTKPENAVQALGDVSFNGDGYQALLAGTLTAVDDDTEGWYNFYGFLLQGGYFVSDTVQLYTRYELISPGDAPGDLENFSAISCGVNFLPFDYSNRWKFTAEAGWLFSRLDHTIVAPSDSLGWLASDRSGQFSLRFQAQLGF